MPFSFTGHCYATSGDALDAFQKAFPLLGDTMWVWHVSSSINASGLITYSLISKPTSTNTTSNRSGTLQLASCGTPDAPVFDPVSAGAIFIFFFSSVVGLWIVAKNIGLILEAIKRW